MPTGVTVRAFVAVKLEGEALSAALQWQRVLAANLPARAVRWTRPEQLHLTLQFLGNVRAGRIAELTSRIEQTLAGVRGFSLALGSLGAFPTPLSPRVLWIGLEGQAGQVADLQCRVADACEEFGDHAEERAFHPHLTVGRVIRPNALRGCTLEAEIEKSAARPAAIWQVATVHLIRSELRPEGVVYSTLAAFSLTDAS